MVDARRDMVAIGAAAEEEGHVARDHVAPRQRAKLALDRELAGMIGRPRDRARQPRRLGHVDEQIVDRAGADRAQHLLRSASASGR